MFRRKFLTFVIILILGISGYFGYGTLFGEKASARYVTAQVKKGTLVVSLSGSGQIFAENQIDVRPKASGDIISISVKNGQAVKTGTLLAQLDTKDAEKVIRDAEINLEVAKLNLKKIEGVRTDEAVLRSVREKAEDDLAKAYEDGFNTIANAFLDVPEVMNGLKNIFFESTISSGQWNADYYAGTVNQYDNRAIQYKDKFLTAHAQAQKAYDATFEKYKSASRFSSKTTIESLLHETYETTKDVAEAVKGGNNLIQFYKDKLTDTTIKPVLLADTHLASLNTYTSKTNAHLLNLLAIQDTIRGSREAIANADIDLADQRIKVRQAEDALLDAKEKLADYFIRAPFDGIVTKVNVKRGDSISPSTVFSTFITRQKKVEISLNEVDIAKIKLNQNAVLTFDAIPDIKLSGTVSEIDTVGTISQGVVTYSVTVAFDTQDERVKPAMSVSADIVTDTKVNVLLVPNSAVKQERSFSYVEIPGKLNSQSAVTANVSGVALINPPEKERIEIGLSNDELTEIISGVEEGDIIIVRTIQTGASQPVQNQQSIFPTGGGGARALRPGGGSSGQLSR